MKSFFKKTIKIILIILLALGLILFIGVVLPKETYKQKNEQVANLLIKQCNIVDVINGEIISNRDILVQNGKIISIDGNISTIPQNAKVFDAKGQYLIPSLWDMHLHTLSLSPQLHFPLLIANGVTGVRDMGDGDSWISDIDDNSTRDKMIWQNQSQEQNLLVPKIIQATSYHLEELEDIDKKNYKQKVAELISKLKARGEPFVKVQLEDSELPEYVFYELQHQAKSQGIPILGHISPNLDMNLVFNNGFKSIEHAWALIPHCINQKKNFKKDIDRQTFELNNQNATITNKVLLQMVNKGVYYVPTHVSSNRKEYLAFEPNINNNPNNVYTENVQLFFWKLINWIHTKGYDKNADQPVLKAYYERGLKLTKLAQKNGVRILAGSDALDRNVYYGISIHDELKEMVKAGLTNAEALRTATCNPAKYYELTQDYGSIEVGKKADFIFLSKNPLENIENTQTINAVFYNNRLYNKEDLDQMKSFVKKQAKSFGISCKFIWNMIKRN